MSKLSMSRTGWRLLLALVLLLVQQVGLRHNLSHAASRDEGPGTHAVCLECVALHASADWLPAAPQHPPTIGHAHVLIALAATHEREPVTERVYQSRAPPRFPV